MIKFGTGGWRAVIGEDFTKENVCLVAQGFVDYVLCKGLADTPIFVGGDRRFLSREATFWFAEVLSGNGIKVFMANRSVPTPFVMHWVQKNYFNFGIEITASHNPANYNGIKIIVREGRDAPVEITDELETYIASVEKIKSLPFPNDNITILKNPFNGYIDDILNVIDVKAIRDSESRVIFDPMYGSGIYPLVCIMYSARCTIDVMNSERDAYFGGSMPAPTEKTLGDLAERVVRGEYDLGIALDGDGDRLGIIDYNGKYINANQILVMLYYYLHEYKGWKGGVVRNLATTHMLDKLAQSFGEKCYEVPIGFKWISSKIDEVDAILGGESSGGLTVRGHIHGKDSIYASALFVEMCAVIGKHPSEIYQELELKFGEHHLVESNLRFIQEEKELVQRKIFIEKQVPFFDKKIVKISYLDGCKVYFDNDDFVICRFSGTEPLLRIFAESSNALKAQKYIDKFIEFLKG